MCGKPLESPRTGWASLAGYGQDVMDSALLLYAEYERLQSIVKVKDAALAMLSDAENWAKPGAFEIAPGEEMPFIWESSDNPIHLAERALATNG